MKYHSVILLLVTAAAGKDAQNASFKNKLKKQSKKNRQNIPSVAPVISPTIISELTGEVDAHSTHINTSEPTYILPTEMPVQTPEPTYILPTYTPTEDAHKPTSKPTRRRPTPKPTRRSKPTPRPDGKTAEPTYVLTTNEPSYFPTYFPTGSGDKHPTRKPGYGSTDDEYSMNYAYHFDLSKSGKRGDKGGKGGSGSKAGKKVAGKTRSKAGKRDAVDHKHNGHDDADDNSKKWGGANQQLGNEGLAKSEKDSRRGGVGSK